MMTFSSDQWIIVALVFVLGLLIGGFLFSGGGRKWKQRYNAEIDRRKELETAHRKQISEWEGREKEWRERDSLRAAALKDRGIVERDRDHDGVPDDRDPVDNRKM